MTSDGSATPNAEPPRVLVVDDDALIGALIGEALKPFRVTFVQSTAGALGRIAAGGSFSAVVCDLLMPGMSGFQFHEELLRVAPDLARRLVFLSGSASAPEVEVLVRRAGVRCLPKPFEPQELRAAVAAAARR
jgi:CheY-like chemotaxis protein